jgi:hypothetical protein
MNQNTFPRKFNSKGRQSNNTSRNNGTWLSFPRKDNYSTIPEKDKNPVAEFDPTKRDRLSWVKARPAIILLFKQNKCWDIVNYEDYGIASEDATIEFKEEELSPNQT